ncbi:hypothetical protein C8R43DRAFT_978441 [Mycena crocata]|nr:hypothetical protein C8R43DRAFT_978441 [Mycena crocata]
MLICVFTLFLCWFGGPSDNISISLKAPHLEAENRAPIPDIQGRPQANRELMPKSFIADREFMEASLQCHICLDLLRQPYVMSCGHVLDLHCMRTWFTSSPIININSRPVRVKACPLCQAVIATPPSPMFALGPILAMLHSNEDEETRAMATPTYSTADAWLGVPF